jgi:hypothetical protein
MYDRPERISYDFNGVAIGAGTVTRVIKGPKGKRGRLADIIATPSTSMVGTTTPGKVQLGDGVTANLYADLFLGTAGAPAQAGAPVVASAVTTIGSTAALKGQDPTVLPWTFLPADTALTITFLQPVGTPAGVIDADIIIEWGI